MRGIILFANNEAANYYENNSSNRITVLISQFRTNADNSN